MATLQRNECFLLDVFKGVHVFGFAGHSFRLYATNTTPDLAADLVKADLAEITAQNGYPANGNSIQQDCSATGGTLSIFSQTDIIWSAIGGNFGPLRYVWLYNDTAASDPLVGGWDFGSSVTIVSGGDFIVDFGANVLSVQ